MPSSKPFLTAAVLLLGLNPAARAAGQPDAASVYSRYCATCHSASGNPGNATPATRVRPYDFSKCSVASAEPDDAWVTAVAGGGPAVGLSSDMPAFGAKLTSDDIRAVVAYLRGLCLDRGWPNGNLNLPRPILTEKAFPEDEVVILPAVSHDRSVPDEGNLAAVFEKRFGKRNNIEVELPFSTVAPAGIRRSGIGDVELAAKRVLFADRAGTRIISAGFEVAFPTGSEPRGLGEGTTRFEPFVAAAWARGLMSLQMTAAFELPKNAPWADRAFEYRAYVGRDLSRDARKWTLGVELTGENRELAITPQVRKGLVKTGALAAAVGVQLPATERGEQRTRVVGYLLWDYREPVRR